MAHILILGQGIQIWHSFLKLTTSSLIIHKMMTSCHLLVKQGQKILKIEWHLMTMRKKLWLLVQDLAFRFTVSEALVSQVFITWVRLLSKELSWLITWPDRTIIRRNLRNLPTIFRKYYPKCRVINDCSEVFVQTPTSLDVAAMCWSNYKSHSTVKFLVGIPPNGAISYISDCYGGRATDNQKLMSYLNSLTQY